MRLLSLSPNVHDRNQLRSPKLVESISNMKIFDETNDGAKPEKTWIDDINKIHHPSPINYDVIHSVTFKPDQLNPNSTKSIFFERRKRRNSPSAHKNSQNNSQNDEDKRSIVSQVGVTTAECKIRVRRNKLNTELYNTTIGDTIARTNDDHINQSTQALANEGEDEQSNRMDKLRGSINKDEETIAKATSKLMVKAINDLKKENERVKDINEKLLARIEGLEKELTSVSDKLKTQEVLWIKNFGNSPKSRPMSPNATFSSKMPVAKKLNPKVKEKANYKENIRTMIHQKYMKKLEDQEIEHQRQMGLFKQECAIQIEELTELVASMSNAMIDVQSDSANKCRNMFDIILEKDVKIEELEQEKDKIFCDMNQNESESELYELKMQISALKTNLKQRDKQVCDLEKSNKKLSSTVSQLKSKLDILNNDSIFKEKKNSTSTKKKEIERKLNDYKNDILKLIH